MPQPTTLQGALIFYIITIIKFTKNNNDNNNKYKMLACLGFIELYQKDIFARTDFINPYCFSFSYFHLSRDVIFVLSGLAIKFKDKPRARDAQTKLMKWTEKYAWEGCQSYYRTNLH
jgi:hypothetical protein